MDFAQQQRNPAKHLVGIAFVIVFHILLVYALIHGLGQSLVDVIKKPVEVKIVEEVKPPPPPPQNLPPPPKLAAPPPPFIPPPEVQIAAPPAVVTMTQTPPPTPQAYQPAVAAAPTGPAAPPAKGIGVVCPGYRDIQKSIEYPTQALRKGLDQGSVTIHFTVKGNGEIADIVIQASNRLFEPVAQSMMSRLKCQGTGTDTPVAWGADFKAE